MASSTQREIVESIRREIHVTGRERRFEVLRSSRQQNAIRLDLRPSIDGRKLDYTLEGGSASWHHTASPVVAVSVDEFAVYVQPTNDPTPRAGEVVIIRPPRFLDALLESWMDDDIANACFNWAAQALVSFGLSGRVLQPSFHELRERQKVAYSLISYRAGFLWGPPGTGKTRTAGSIVSDFALTYPDSKILLIAPTNASVDQLLIAVDDRLASFIGGQMLRKHCARIGSNFLARYYSNRPHLIPLSTDDLLQEKARLEAVQPEAEDFGAVAVWKRQMERVSTAMRAQFIDIVEKKRIVAMTAALASMHYKELHDLAPFSLGVLDEASQLGRVVSMMLAPLAEQVLIAGDPKQLPPIFSVPQASVAKWFGRTLFDDYMHKHHNSLLTSLDPTKFPEQTRPYRKDTIFKLIGAGDKKSITLSPADQSATIRLVEENKRDIAHKAPERLLQLRKDIELVALEVLITKVEEMLGKNLPESRWQELLNDNPFILNLAFGYPVIKVQDQAHIGGRRLSGTSDTIADFLVKNRISNNAALFEIKTPGTPLLHKTPYRGHLYTPSSDLSGAINQMLDQKNKFQKEIATLKENSRLYDLESYAVHGVLIVGTTPQGIEQQKSFELFRGNSKDITIVTFDELLQKLRLLHSFLSDIPEARQASKLHNLETKALQLQNGLHELYEYGESKSGKLKMMTMKPFPGIDAKRVTAVGGRLSVLRHGFERVRLEKPPYPVAFDDSGNRTVKVASVDEFISYAEKALADAEAVLESQLAAKNAAT